jgi:DNA-3-methyladenine glycosylase II
VYHDRMVRIIETPADIDEAVNFLCDADPRLAEIRRSAGLPPLRRLEGGFAGLAAIIVSQQLSVASAAAIWARTRTAFDPLSPATILAADEAVFRGAGLSAPKIRTLRALAEAVRDGLDLEALAACPAEEAVEKLVAVKGIGPWTADIYLMFCIGHADAFAAGDLALQEAARRALTLAERPSAVALLEEAEAWRPWRGVAARMLWAYYRATKAGRGGAPMNAA